MAPSHYQNQYWLFVSEVMWYSPNKHFTASAKDDILYNELEKHTFEITITSPRVQWVNDKSYDFIKLAGY